MGVAVCIDKRFQKKLKAIKEDPMRIVPVILASTGLCHDIGNPPFGHYGEEVITNFFSDYFKRHKVLSKSERLDFTKFNGNAEGFRILTKTQVLQDTYGLNLTIGTLSSFLKYPLLANEIDQKGSKKKDKLGVFQSEKETVERIRQVTSLGLRRHPLSFLMEAADDICYLIMDIEDGYKKRYYKAEDVLTFMKENGNDSVRGFADECSKGILKNLKSIYEETTKMVRLRVRLFTKLVNMACKEFLDKINEIEDGSYSGGLIMNEENGFGETLQYFCREKIYAEPEIHSLELTGRSVLYGLLRHFVNGLMDTNASGWKQRAKKLQSVTSESIRTITELETHGKLEDCNKYFKLRLGVDHISGMTDSYALNLYRKLEGMRLG
jgi:dGTPase